MPFLDVCAIWFGHGRMSRRQETQMAAEKTAPKLEPEEAARRIWLAGVGAYGRMFEEAQDRIGKAAGSANELFDQLVARGEVLEHAVRDRLASAPAIQGMAVAVDKLQDLRDAQRAAVKTRIDSVRKAVDQAVAPFNPLAMDRMIQELEARVAKLEAAQAKPVVRRAAAKPATRKVGVARKPARKA
jgi:hypothetical protein